MKNSPLYVDLLARLAIFCNTLSFCSMLTEAVTKSDIASPENSPCESTMGPSAC